MSDDKNITQIKERKIAGGTANKLGEAKRKPNAVVQHTTHTATDSQSKTLTEAVKKSRKIAEDARQSKTLTEAVTKSKTLAEAARQSYMLAEAARQSHTPTKAARQSHTPDEAYRLKEEAIKKFQIYMIDEANSKAMSSNKSRQPTIAEEMGRIRYETPSYGHHPRVIAIGHPRGIAIGHPGGIAIGHPHA